MRSSERRATSSRKQRAQAGHSSITNGMDRSRATLKSFSCFRESLNDARQSPHTIAVIESFRGIHRPGGIVAQRSPNAQAFRTAVMAEFALAHIGLPLVR